MKPPDTVNLPEYGKVTVIAPIFEYFPILAPSMIAQRYQNWELICIHDGPNERVKNWIGMMEDPRIKYMETDNRYNDWGHTLRTIALGYIEDTDFILHTNMDNYYVPVFLDCMLQHFGEHDVALFCQMIHSHKEYHLWDSWLERAAIDCGAMLWRAKPALELGWKSRQFCADWDMIAEGIVKFGAERFKKISMPFFVHN